MPRNALILRVRCQPDFTRHEINRDNAVDPFEKISKYNWNAHFRLTDLSSTYQDLLTFRWSERNNSSKIYSYVTPFRNIGTNTSNAKLIIPLRVKKEKKKTIRPPRIVYFYPFKKYITRKTRVYEWFGRVLLSDIYQTSISSGEKDLIPEDHACRPSNRLQRVSPTRERRTNVTRGRISRSR